MPTLREEYEAADPSERGLIAGRAYGSLPSVLHRTWMIDGYAVSLLSKPEWDEARKVVEFRISVFRQGRNVTPVDNVGGIVNASIYDPDGGTDIEKRLAEEVAIIVRRWISTGVI